MGDDRFSSTSYTRTREETAKDGGATKKAEQRHKEGKPLNELVDPAGFNATRRSKNRFTESGNMLVLACGIAMLKESRFDTTSSMGNSVDLAFDSLPKSYHLLAEGDHAVLGRYDTQIITAIFGDRVDKYILQRSQAEMNNKIAEQMTMMVPERGGGDYTEDPQYGIFSAAYLTAATINQYGLKSYDFTTTDADSREKVSPDGLRRVFGPEVFARLKENGFEMNENDLPELTQMVKDLKKRAHAFLICIGSEAHSFWQDFYGKQHVILLEDARLLAETEAAIIGLTEGNLTLSTLEKFLTKDAGLTSHEAETIKRAVAHIPIGAQMALPGFDKIPLKGAMFAKKDDLWPTENAGEKPAPEKEKDKTKEKKKAMWD